MKTLQRLRISELAPERWSRHCPRSPGPRRNGSGLAAAVLVLGATAVAAQTAGDLAEVVAEAEPCLNLRPGPGTTGEPLRCLPPGRRMTVLESSEGWGRVRLPDGQEGWVALRLVGAAPDRSSPPAPEEGESEKLRQRIADLEESLGAAESRREEAEEKSAAAQAELAKALASAESRREEAEEGFETARSEVEALRGANERLEVSAAEREASESAARARIADLEESLAAAAAERAELAETLRTADAERSELAGALDTAGAERLELEEALASSGAEQANLKESLAEAETERSELGEALATAETERSELEKSVADVEAERAELQEALAAAGRERERLEAERADLEAGLATLRAEVAEQQAAVDDLAGRLRAAESFLSKSESLRFELTEELETLRRENERLRDEAGASRLAEVGTGEAEQTEERLEAEAPLAGPSVEARPEERSVEPPVTEDVMALLEAWSRAWSEQRVEEYLSFYSSAFEPPGGLGRAEWESQRRERLTRPTRIEVLVALVGLVEGEGDRLEVDFVQSYESDRFSDVVVKTLELVREGGAWKIAAERTE